ncbi:MAG: hypothetical protein P4M14_10685 [Gammaproteobacteria bacterium]|nr:hypothetical protein [Gammaproteobacteria bacterium]
MHRIDPALKQSLLDDYEEEVNQLEPLQSVNRRAEVDEYVPPVLSSAKSSQQTVDFFGLGELPQASNPVHAHTVPDFFMEAGEADEYVPAALSPAKPSPQQVEDFLRSEPDGCVPVASASPVKSESPQKVVSNPFMDSDVSPAASLIQPPRQTVDFLGLGSSSQSSADPRTLGPSFFSFSDSSSKKKANISASAKDHSAVVANDNEELLAFLSQSQPVVLPAASATQQAMELTSINLSSPRQAAAVVEQDDITDELALEHAEQMAAHIVDYYADQEDTSTSCSNQFTNLFYKCVPLTEVERAQALQTEMQLASGDYEKIARLIIDMVKTGKVEDLKGKSSFASDGLRGMFINHFVPNYSKHFTMQTQWLRAVKIRQGIWIETFDRDALIKVAKDHLHQQATAQPSQRMR